MRTLRSLAILASLAFSTLTVAVLLADDPPATGDKPAKSRPEEVYDEPPKATGKKPRTEEVNPVPPPRRTIPAVPEDDAGSKTGTTSPKVEAGVDLAAEARKTKNLSLRELYRTATSHYDLVTFVGNRSVRVLPVGPFVGDDPKRLETELELRDLDQSNKPGKPYRVAARVVKTIEHYEQRVLQAVDHFETTQRRFGEGDPQYLARPDQLAAIEAVLAGAVNFHESAKTTHQRSDDGWEPIEEELRDKLREVMVQRLRLLADENQWDEAFALSERLAASLPGRKDQEKIVAPLADLIGRALKSGIKADSKTRTAMKRLRALNERFPGNESTKPLTKIVHDYSEKLLEEAKKLEASRDPDKRKIDELLKLGVELQPEFTDLRSFQLKIAEKTDILRVGVRMLPTTMTPETASTDSERQAVELMFEGLVRAAVDAAGNTHFAPQLAEGRPRTVPLGRVFRLPHNAFWSDGRPLTAVDVRESLGLLKKGSVVGALPALGELLDDVSVDDPFRVQLKLKQGFVDPLSLMTFKIMPPGCTDPNFATKPIGSGPYRFDPEVKLDGTEPCAAFVANPYYGDRDAKKGLPRIREIRFYKYGDPVEALTRVNTRLDLLLDLTPTEASQVHQKVEGFKAKVLTPTESKRPNRRVYFLAVNQASDKRILAQADFRRALALGINREDLLDQYFRGGKTDLGLGKLHVALNGPYPAHSWACDPKVSKPKTSGRDTLDPFDPLGARALLEKLKVADPKSIRLELKYPEGDPDVEAAMAGLCAQLEANLGIAVTPVKKEPHALREDVEIKRTYDLAYYHYDFPDETYWLWPLLAPRAPTAAGNYLEFSGTDKLQQLLRDAKERRNFTVLRDRTLMIHKLLSEETPVVPLWQLDPLNAVNQDVKYDGGFDPLLVFPDVETWRLERTAR